MIARPSRFFLKENLNYEKEKENSTGQFRLMPKVWRCRALVAVIGSIIPLTATPFKVQQAWSTKHWCASVLTPEWPFEYGKTGGQAAELKGRTSSSAQHFGHTCARRAPR